jgi:PKD repeat protein
MIKMKFASQIVFLFLIIILVNGCKDDGFPVPPASTVPLFSYSVDNDGFAPATVSFTNESIIPEASGAPIYSWKFGDGTSSTDENPIHLYTLPGLFDVKLTVKTTISIEIVELTQTISIKNANASGVPVYFTDGSLVYVGLVNEDKPLFSALNIGPFKDSYGLALDTVHSKLYISDFDAKKIVQCDLDGKNQIDFRINLPGPDGLAIDYEGNMLYWDTDDGIQRADISNPDVNQIEDFVTGKAAFDPEGVSVDPVNKRIYWTNYEDNGGIWMKNIDGTGEAVIAPLNLVAGGSILVVGERIYFDQFIATGDIQIKSSLLNGTGISTISTNNSKVVFGIGYEPNSKQIYWGDRTPGKIMRANLDGSGVETWYTSAGSSPRGIVFGKKK